MAMSHLAQQAHRHRFASLMISRDPAKYEKWDKISKVEDLDEAMELRDRFCAEELEGGFFVIVSIKCPLVVSIYSNINPHL